MLWGTELLMLYCVSAAECQWILRYCYGRLDGGFSFYKSGVRSMGSADQQPRDAIFGS